MTDTHDGYTAQEWASHYHQLVADTQEHLHRIAAKQQRDNTERTPQFRVVTIAEIVSYGESTPNRITIDVHRDDIGDYTTAQKIAGMYDNAEIQTRTTTPWKTITANTTPDTGT